MNIVLWILQIALCVKLLSTAYTHGLRVDEAKMQQGKQRLGGAARPLLILASLCAFLGGVALILPAATGMLAWLTPLAAALVALMMLLAMGLHAVCHGARTIVFGLVIFVLAAFVAYGRWVLAPF
jgi:VIT1/CCC1 family predicted Fe2+/Mn2+ transporter